MTAVSGTCTRWGAAGDLLAAAMAQHGGCAWVLSKEELLDDGWLGPGRLGRGRRRVGDVVLAARMRSRSSTRRCPARPRLISAHGSLTAAEMRVPLLAAHAGVDAVSRRTTPVSFVHRLWTAVDGRVDESWPGLGRTSDALGSNCGHDCGHGCGHRCGRAGDGLWTYLKPYLWKGLWSTHRFVARLRTTRLGVTGARSPGFDHPLERRSEGS